MVSWTLSGALQGSKPFSKYEDIICLFHYVDIYDDGAKAKDNKTAGNGTSCKAVVLTSSSSSSHFLHRHTCFFF